MTIDRGTRVAETPPPAVVKDSASIGDSTAPRSRSAIDSRIDYKAKDSLFFDLRTNKAYLYEKAQVNYKDIELKAALIEVDFTKQEVSAFPKIDSLGHEVDRPFFSDKKQTFQARELTYNFQSERARIKNIVTQEGEMIIHGDLVKKLPNNDAFVKRARFTTCDLEHPHFHIEALRAKIIPGDKVVTGGAMFFLNDVPTPLAVPFGLFPNTTKNTSGVIIPSYGESRTQGFFLMDGGFYWSINDYLDWKITGDIYSRGEWKLRNALQYAKRYKFSGRFGMENGMVPDGEYGTPNYSQTRSLRIDWTHRQDDKANQNSTFSASVNYFNSASQQFSSSLPDRFNNQSTSNISYQLRIANRFNLATAANLNYNIATGDIAATLPSISFSMNPIYPFQRKISKGNPKWYESFKVNYSMRANNQMSGVDRQDRDTNRNVFWTQETLKEMKSGITHNVPLEMNVKLFKGKINWNHTVQYSEQWHFKAITRGLDTNFREIKDTAGEIIRIDTTFVRGAVQNREYGFWATRDYSYSTTFNTTLYGTVQSSRGLIRGFRHMMRPSIGFRLSPDFITAANGYRYYEDENGEQRRYNIFDESWARPPSGVKSGSINFGLTNRFEMKVRDRKDTLSGGTRKIVLIEDLALTTSYNLAADSLNWAPITLTARTTLFQGLSLRYRAEFSLYDVNSNNQAYNRFIWQTDRIPFFLKSESMNTALSWSFKSKERNEHSTTQPTETRENASIFEKPATFDVRWSLNVSYTIEYRSNFRPDYHQNNIWGYPTQEFFSMYDRRISQTLTLNGNVDLTQKWNINFYSGFDFNTKKLSSTTFNISRDLHCWTMSFSWTPFGYLRQWNVSIRLNSPMLRDVMKYDRKSSIRETDNYF
ncbi:MAG: hypothetical protein LBH22_02795 [Bacteroidales bacterium]|nr:hypothetical protein [Bacteroidales bacterium]